MKSDLDNATLHLLVECELATSEIAQIAKHCDPSELKTAIRGLGCLSKKISKHLRENQEVTA